jgi:endonuclease/exonuclease/phosphatase (EEP) superfamily protein YafD
MSKRRLLTVIVWLAVLPFAVWLPARLLGWQPGIRGVQLMALTPYAAVAALVPLVVAAATRRLWPALIAAIVVLGFAFAVLPRWITDGTTVDAKGPQLRVLSANMLLGGADPGALTALVRSQRADLLALQEFTPAGQEALEKAGLLDVLPHSVTYAREGIGGSALYSRFDLSDGHYRLFPSTFGQAAATMTVPGAPKVLVESVHPCAPAAPSRNACWHTDLAAQPHASDHPDGAIRLLAGDFNATLDHVEVRRLIDTGYRDAGDVMGRGLTFTYPMDRPTWFPGVTIDHVLVDRRVAVDEVSAHVIVQSDHRALFAALRLPPG